MYGKTSHVWNVVREGGGGGDECDISERPNWMDLRTLSLLYFEIKEEDAQTKTPRNNQINVERTSVQA